ncbi:MAG: hypothetical protein AABW73_04655 [Nanoarchaeota archaeon]
MVSPLIQYDPGTIETWRTSRLGNLYMNSFSFSDSYPEESSQTERIAFILSRRSLGELKPLLREIDVHLDLAKKAGHSQNAGMLEKMREHFKERVLGPAKKFKDDAIYGLLGLAQGYRERSYVHSFLEYHANPSSNNKRELDLSVRMMLDGQRTDSEIRNFHERMAQDLESKVRVEAYEDCCVVRDMVNHYRKEVQISV